MTMGNTNLGQGVDYIAPGTRPSLTDTRHEERVDGRHAYLAARVDVTLPIIPYL